MKLPNWLRKLNRGTHYYKTVELIEIHREITKEAEKAVDEMIASLDGETGWIDCSCLPKKDRQCNLKETGNVRTLSDSA